MFTKDKTLDSNLTRVEQIYILFLLLNTTLFDLWTEKKYILYIFFVFLWILKIVGELKCFLHFNSNN